MGYSPTVYEPIAYGKKKKKREDEKSLDPRELTGSYKQRMEAIGIEPPKEETHRGGNPAWNFLKSTLNFLNAPANMIASTVAEIVSPEKYEGNVLTAMKEGLLNQRHTSFSNVLEDVGVENKWLRTLGGLGLDIVLDPTTYLGIGTLTKAGKSGKVMGEVVENALKYADEIPDIGRAAKMVTEAVDKGGDVGKAASEFADTVRRIAGEVADPDVAKALSNMGKQADKFASSGAKSLGLAPTRTAQAAARERALVNFAGIPVVGGEGVFSALGKGGQALRGSTLGKAVGDIFDYGAPLRKTDIGSEGIEKVIEGRRSLPSTKKVAAAAEEARVEDIYKALPEEMRGADIFEQAKREIPIGTKTREIVEPVEGVVKKGAKQTDELSETKRLVEYQDEVKGFRPDMTPEQRTVAQQREGLMREYLEVENAHNIRTKELAELQDQDDILALLYADLPTDYAMHMRSDAAWDYIREHGEESVKGKLKKVLEGPGFTKQRTHRETIDAFNRGMREKLGVDFDWFETDMLKIDKARGAMHARLVEEAKMLEDWSKITDVDGNPLVRLVGEADEVPEGMQRLPGYLSNYAAKDEVIDFLDRVAPKYSEDGIKTFTELLEVPTSIWRGYATATPGFVGRNAISNFWQLFLKDGAQGLNPRRAWLTAEWMMGKNLDASIVTKSGKIIDGHTFMREATKHDIFEVGIMGSLAPTEEAGGALGTAAKAGGGADEAAKAGLSAVNPLSREFFPVKGIRSINTKVEQHAKAMGYLNDLMKGDSFADAAINTKKFLFDYCVDDKTEILTARGWQTIYTLQYGDEVLTLNLNNDNVKWSPIQSIFCRPYADELNHITSNRFDAMVTDNHRWVKKRTCSSRPLGFTTTQEATKKKMILKIAGGDYKAPKKAAYSDEFVELVGWYITEGWFQKYGQGVQIAQSSKRNPKYVERIRKLAEHFNTKGATVSEYTRDVGWGDIHSFYFGKGIGGLLREAAPGKELRPEFLLSLTKKQLLLLYKTLMDGDGTRDKRNKNGDPHERWTQFDEQRQDGFQMLCALLGKRTHNRDGRISVYKSEDIYTNSLKTEKVYYKGPIWCVTTADGTWFARRNGVTYWTGNSRLTPKEKVLRTYAPFMTWTRKNIPLQVEQLIAQPGKFAGVGKVRRSAMEAFSDPETGQYTPGYFDELFAIPTPFNIGGGQMWLNPDLPFQDLQTLTQPKDIWGMLNPLLKAPVELGMDKEMFFGRPIQGEEGRKVRTPAALRWLENIPGVSGLLGMDKIRDYYSEDPNAMTSGMNPRLDYLFRQIPMLNTLSKIMDFAAPTEKHVADALSGGLGVKFYQFNPEVEKTSVGWENVSNYQDFMNILQKQYGVDIPSTDTLERFLRYLYGQPVESEYTLRKQDPSLDYLAYLQKVTGIMPPYSLEDIEAFKQMYDVGDVTLPGTASSKASSPISVIPNMVKGQSKDPLKSWKAKMRRQYGIKF